jgi:hypothetical protein
MKLIVFLRDDSLHPRYNSESFHQWDVIEIIEDNTNPGRSVDKQTFGIIKCKATKEQLIHLKEPLEVPMALNGQILKQRKYSLDFLDPDHKKTLLSGGQVTLSLDDLTQVQRKKNG